MRKVKIKMNFNIMKQYNTILTSTETHSKAKKVQTNSQTHRQFRSLQPHLVPYGKRETKVLGREEDCQVVEVSPRTRRIVR